MRAALGARDITRVFRLLQKVGFSQQRIAALTGQSQPEVSAIIHGRRVMAYDVLARIADGLGIPRGAMGLAYVDAAGMLVAPPPEADQQWEGDQADGGQEECGRFTGGTAPAGGQAGRSYGGDRAGPDPGADRAAVGRRTFLGQAAAITVGAAMLTSEFGELPAAAAEVAPVPSRIGMSDVRQIREATAALRGLDYLHGGGACRDAAAAQLSWAEGMLRSDATEEVGRQLRVAVADLRNLVGWTSLDLGQPAAAEQHFLRALNMAKEAEAHDLVANVLYRMARVSLPVDPEASVRTYRLAELAAQDAGSPLTNAIVAANHAWALGMLGRAKEADRALGLAEEQLAKANLTEAPGWARFFDETDLFALQGMTYLALGEYDQRFTAKAIDRLRESTDLRVPEMARSKAFDLTALAVAHYRQGDLDHGSVVANAALDAAGVLKSARAIDRLRPLAAEAARRPDAAEVREVGERLAETVAAMSPGIAQAAARISAEGDGTSGTPGGSGLIAPEVHDRGAAAVATRPRGRPRKPRSPSPSV
jgi:transcriptional regulator with XRE-family HTH domain